MIAAVVLSVIFTIVPVIVTVIVVVVTAGISVTAMLVFPTLELRAGEDFTHVADELRLRMAACPEAVYFVPLAVVQTEFHHKSVVPTSNFSAK